MMRMYRGYGIFGGITLLGILVIGLGIYLLVNYVSESKKESKQSITQSNRALNILDERYAMGEIDENEFKKMKKTLLED